MSVDLGSAIGYLDLDTSKFHNGIKGAMSDLKIFSDSSATTTDKMTALSSAMNKTGSSLTIGLTLPLVGVGAAALKLGNDFEAQMSRVKGISGATGEEFKKLEQQALDLGASTAFSASEVALGMENLSSAGFNAVEIMSAMPGMLDLAASSGADLATASEIAASSLRGFGLDASEAGHVADVFAVAAADTNAQVEDMGEAMKYAAPVSRMLGISLEETAAAIGIMSDAGIKGSQAGTSLRGALAALLRPSDEAKSIIEELGISFYDQEGRMKSITEITEMLGVSMADLTEEQRNQYLVTIFGREALSGMLSLIQRGPDELAQLTKSLENSDGAAQAMADTMMDNTKGAIEEMMGALETSAILIQRSLAPAVTQAANFIGDLANKFNELDEDTKQTIITIAGVVAVAGPLLLIGGNLIGMGVSIVETITGVNGVLSLMGQGLGLLNNPLIMTITILGGLYLVFKNNSEAADLLLIGIGSLIAGYAAFQGVAFVQGILLGFQAASMGLTGALLAEETALVSVNSGIAIHTAVKGAAATGTAILTGATIAYNTIVGIATGNITLASVAQGIWNTIMAANPIGLVIAGVVGLVAGIIGLVSWLNRTSEETKNVVKENNKLIDNNKALLDSVEKNNNAYNDSITTARATAGANRELLGEIESLVAMEEMSAGQKELLKIKIQELNSSVPGLSLAYNENTGALNMNAEAINNHLQAQEAELELSAMIEEQNRLRAEKVRLLLEQTATEERILQIQALLSEADNLSRGDKKALNDELEKLVQSQGDLDSALAMQEIKYQTLNGSIEEHTQVVEEATQKKAELGEEERRKLLEGMTEEERIIQEKIQSEEELTQTMQEEATKRGLTLEDYQKEQERFAEESKRVYDKMVSYTSDAFNKIKKEQKVTLEEMSENLEHNTTVTDKWSKDLNELSGRAIDEFGNKMDEDFIQMLWDLGPEYSETVKDLVGRSDAELKALSDKYSKSTETALESMRRQMGLPENVDSGKKLVDDISAGVKNNKALETEATAKVETTKKSFDSAVKSNNFEGVGKEIMTGVANGILNNQSLAINATSTVATNIKNKFKSELQIQSPSRVFYTLGEYINQGLSQGLYDSSGLPTNTMDGIAREILRSGDTISEGLISKDAETGTLIYDQTYEAIHKKIDLYYQDRDKRISLMTAGTEANLTALDREIRATEQAYDVKMKLYEQEFRAKMAIVDAESAAQLSAIQAQIDAISELREKERRDESTVQFKENLEEKTKAIDEALRRQQEAEEALDDVDWTDDKSRIKAEDELLKAKEAVAKATENLENEKRRREKELLEQSRQDQTNALRNEMAEIRQQTQDKKDQMREEYEAKKMQLEQQRDDELAIMKELEEKLEDNYKLRKELDETQTKIAQTEKKNQTSDEYKELLKRESDLKTSLKNNESELIVFRDKSKDIAYQNGRNFVDGFRSTENELFSYLDKVISRARAAKAASDAARAAADSAGVGFSFSGFIAGFSGLFNEVARSDTSAFYSKGNNFRSSSVIDYDRLAQALGKLKSTTVEMVNHITSPTPLDEREVRRQQDLLLRDLAFEFL